MNLMNPVSRLKGKLIVSCQAFEGEPLYGPEYMVAMAKCAFLGGAGGIRANGPFDIKAIKETVNLPVIGIYKFNYSGYEPYITPTLEAVKIVINSGADIVAIDATNRVHPFNVSAQELIRSIKKEFEIPVMADISTLEEGIAAMKAGADIVGTTLRGYTTYTAESLKSEPPFKLLEELNTNVKIPVIAEGRIWTSEEVYEAFQKGAYAVTVGAAITRPQLITSRFVEYIEKMRRVKH